MKIAIKIIFVIQLLNSAVTFAGGGGGSGGGGGCTFGDNPGSPTTITAGTVYSGSNVSCGATNSCYPVDIASCPTCNCTFDECIYQAMGATCSFVSCFCGSPENTMYANFCPATTGSYIFSVSNVVCTGGGASLQWGIKAASTSCSTGYDMYCDGSVTGNQSSTESLTGGTCYTIFFDGNAAAQCTFDFQISAVPLPIKLVSFTGEKMGTSVQLSWTTATEKNNERFEVERSMDGKVFQIIGNVDGAGDSESNINYSFVDKSPLQGFAYYRLRQVDYDGKFEVSNTLGLVYKTDKEIKVVQGFMNHNGNELHVVINSDFDATTNLSIYDLKGDKKIANNDVLVEGENSVTLNTSALSKGVYFLCAQVGDKKAVHKFVKN